MKYIVYHIQSGCDVHNGLYCIDEFLDQLVLLKAITHRETGLHGMELVTGLDLHRGQCHRCATMDAMKCNLLDMGQDIMEAGIDEGAWVLTATVATFAASRRDSNCTVRTDDHRNKEDIKAKTVEIKIKVFLKSILPATMASDSASRARGALASSSTA